MEVLFFVTLFVAAMVVIWMGVLMSVTGRPYIIWTKKAGLEIEDELVKRVSRGEIDAPAAVEEFRDRVGCRYLAFSPGYIRRIYAADGVQIPDMG
ncbi:MAG: hypothetical protein KAJ55_00215 [Anaerolineales bacterium]|nr:hypothetical protein [Anaerolineales bacterium]